MIRPTIILTVLLALAAPVVAQVNPVYVDDSPRAWELLQRAQDQSRDNVSEAVRIYQELLEDYGMKLVPVSEAGPDHLVAVRRRVLHELGADDALLERYRTIATAEAQRLLDAGELETLALTRSLTAPGLEALMRLSQLEVESGHFRTALGWLVDARAHPDLDGREAVSCWLLSGLAASYLGDVKSYNAALAQLERLGGAETALEELRAQPPIDDERDGITVLDRTSASELNDLVAQEIWSVKLSDSLLNRRFRDVTDDVTPRHPAFERRRAVADLATVAVTVAGPNLYVNQGHTILSINRLTGRENWSYVDRPAPAVVDRDNDQMTDLSIIAATDESIVTLTGHAFPMGRSSQGRVVCLDAETGDLRWTQDIDGIGGLPDHEDLFPHGAPIVAEGRVYLLARKVSRQLLTSCYVVALDVEDGRYLWGQHIASSGGVRRSGRPFSSLTYDDGSLFVATAVGGIARLDAATGECVWLQRFNVPINPTSQDQDRRPWEMSSPVVTERGVIALEPGLRRVVLLDRDTGDSIESHSARTRDGWATPAYLLANDHSVYAIGREIRSFRIEDLEQPLWRLPVDDPIAGAPSSRFSIRGRVQLVDGALVVPTLDGVLLIDDETGEEQHRLATKPIGNPLAIGSQLLLAGGDRLDAYMSFGRAERLLRERINADAADPEPALSLLRLARRARDLDLALESADLVVDAVEHADEKTGDAARSELFGMLLAIADERIFDAGEDGERLYGIIGSVSASAEQRVQYQLSYGDWLIEHDFERAIEAYQAILSDPALARSWRAESGTVRTADAWAVARLGEVVKRHGMGVYATQADYASVRLDMARRNGVADPDTLVAIAAEFPFAPAATDAALDAASIERGRGDYRSALAGLTTALRSSEQQRRSPQLLQTLIEVSLEAGFDEQAISLLRWGLRRDPQLTFTGVAGPRRADDWLAGIAQRTGDRRPTRLGSQHGVGREFEGRVVAVHPSARRVSPDVALISTGNQLRMKEARDLADRWTVPIEGDPPSILQLDDEGVLLWSGADSGDPWATMLSTADGGTRWSTASIFDVLPQPRATGRDNQDRMPNGAPFDPSEILPLPASDTLVVAQRNGGIVAFNLDDAGVQWMQVSVLEQIHMAIRHDYGIVLAGLDRAMNGPAAGDLVPRIVVLDPATGTPLHTLRPRAGVNWMEVDALGGLVIGTGEAIELFDLLDGDRVLANITYAAMDTQSAWPLAERVLVKDRALSLRSLDLIGGGLSEPFEAPLRGDWDPLDLREVVIHDDLAFARYKQRIVRYGPDGKILGADIVMDERDYKWLIVGDDRLVVVSGRTDQALMPDRAGRRTQYVYRIYSLSDNCKLLSDPLELKPARQRVDDSAAIDGWLLMSRSSTTLAVPFPK